MFFFSFLCSGISDLVLGTLKMLILVYFRDVLQPTVNSLFLGWYKAFSQFAQYIYRMYSKCLPLKKSFCALFWGTSFLQ